MNKRDLNKRELAEEILKLLDPQLAGITGYSKFALIDEYAKELAQAVIAEDWQPIETAPKDRLILSEKALEIAGDGRYHIMPAARELLQQLAQAVIAEDWVSVDERLPEGNIDVLWYQPDVVRGRKETSLRERIVVSNAKPGPRLTTHWKPITPPRTEP